MQTISQMKEAFRSSVIDVYRTEQLAWDMYFANLVGIQMHPANNLDPLDIDLDKYAELADRMLKIRRERY